MGIFSVVKPASALFSALQYDKALTKPVLKSLTDLEIAVLINTAAKGRGKTGLSVENTGKQIELPAVKILVVVRCARGDSANLASLGLEQNGPFIVIDVRQWDKACIPAACFTDPEIVSGGLSPDDAKGARHPRHRGHVSFCRQKTRYDDGI